MHARRKATVLVTTVMMILALSLAPQGLPVLKAQADRPVLAFYYAWFDANTWTLPLPHQPRAPYVSTDPIAIENHVLLARQAGIDALVLDWYGPQVENNQTETNFRILLEKAAVHGLHASLTVDIAGPFINNVSDLTNALLAVRDQHSPHAAFLRVEGKPVVFFWRQNLYTMDTWKALRQQIDPDRTMLWIAEGIHPEALQVFDGLYLYSVAWSDDPASVLIRWGNEVRRWAENLGSRKYWVATVMPGYNDFATGRADAFIRERAEGGYYRAAWNGAILSNADWVVITSFNEWLEGTSIEPAKDYGDFYLHLTRELAQQYQQMQPQTPTAIPEQPTATIEPTPEPTATLEAQPTDTPEPSPTATVTPTSTLPPTSTPIRLPTPTPRLSGDAPGAPQNAMTPGSDGTRATPTSGPFQEVIPQRHAVEGSEARRSIPPLVLAALVVAAGCIGVPLLRWWRGQRGLK